MVGMTRAHLADPHIARKVAEGREHQIRPCVGMAYCIELDLFRPGRLHPQCGDGARGDDPACDRKERRTEAEMVVVGAGPAGLEAARVAGERGHEVVVLEAAAKAGGQVRIAAGLKRRREIMGIVDWRLAECARLGVAIRCNVYAEAANVTSEDPDVVVVATGGVPNMSFLDAGQAFATSSWDILAGAVKPAANGAAL